MSTDTKRAAAVGVLEGPGEAARHQTPGFLGRLAEDLSTPMKRDPAARGPVEVLLSYPGVHALITHRVAHAMWRSGFRLAARLLSQFSRMWTGIEIHPGAVIGRRVFIDHGMGVVIGETAEVGDDVLLYHGVTLGGTSLDPGKRHPTVGNGVIIGAGATILGDIEIGDGTRIGAGAIVVKEVPPGATVVGVTGRVVREGRVTQNALSAHSRPLLEQEFTSGAGI